jgi:hypothetical protein
MPITLADLKVKLERVEKAIRTAFERIPDLRPMIPTPRKIGDVIVTPAWELDSRAGRSDDEIHALGQKAASEVSNLRDYLRSWAPDATVRAEIDAVGNSSHALLLLRDIWNVEKHPEKTNWLSGIPKPTITRCYAVTMMFGSVAKCQKVVGEVQDENGVKVADLEEMVYAGLNAWEPFFTKYRIRA